MAQLFYRYFLFSWWRHQMETFSALLAICAGSSPVPDEFTAQRPVTRSFDVFFHLRLNKRLSKQSWGWWFETLSHPLWRHRNVLLNDMLSHGNDEMGIYRTTPMWRLLLHGLTSVPTWISNHMHSKVWDEITYPVPNFNSYTVGIWEWIRNFTHIL